MLQEVSILILRKGKTNTRHIQCIRQHFEKTFRGIFPEKRVWKSFPITARSKNLLVRNFPELFVNRGICLTKFELIFK